LLLFISPSLSFQIGFVSAATDTNILCEDDSHLQQLLQLIKRTFFKLSAQTSERAQEKQECEKIVFLFKREKRIQRKNKVSFFCAKA
jgi:hypothetical protein